MNEGSCVYDLQALDFASKGGNTMELNARVLKELSLQSTALTATA